MVEMEGRNGGRERREGEMEEEGRGGERREERGEGKREGRERRGGEGGGGGVSINTLPYHDEVGVEEIDPIL